ncbi:tyrosine-type recombinase/integrase [Clostridium beijerinckii]|uniref:tyrosine-type recombinase/integrase n=1 Tax=Clostridium beijerinckii TaxID=1520 RepID=UPI0006BB4D9F|nr:tyrosine-type recombinase/integrase [Clostridium beijerinckii]ALB44088.1 integrase [Clostridium beijerinckii NRRL B-598]ALB47785.1 integrase [Clostridium beijerinckii NRRL B-598]
MNNVRIQEIKRNQQSKYDEIIEYLKQDNEYWLENDKWDLTEEFFLNQKINGRKSINFSNFKNKKIKNEVKFYFLYNFKEKLLTSIQLSNRARLIKHFSKFLKNEKSVIEFNKEKALNRWRVFLIAEGISYLENNQNYFGFVGWIIDFISSFYDDREETQKDIWYSKNIKGAKLNATSNRKTNNLNFNDIPKYYRETVKRYFKTIITKKSWSHCFNILVYLKFLFNSFYSDGYKDGFIENLTRNDIENFLFLLNENRKGKSKDETNKYLSQIRTFLEYIQMAQYDKAPKKEVSFLIFQDDIIKQENKDDQRKRIKFIPEPILKQLDNNIMDLDRAQFIPIYILLRETGWRGTDILNLRYHNCLEQIWNNKEQQYNYYLCGEITKTGISQLKIPIRDKVAEMVQKTIDKTKELSVEENNPNKYLFNIYEGKQKGKPLAKAALLLTIKRLIKQKDIRDVNGELYHFRLHSLRHTRAKEYVEQGMGISIIQQILGHQSLQMTVHYATVTENTLYEKWKNAEDLELFKVDTKTNDLEKVDLSSDAGENLVRYEYVKKNLDAVRVPFGVCFKPDKFICKQQMNHCLNCGSFCTTVENIPEYEEEIEHVKKQIAISERFGRELWAEKNKTYLKLLDDTLTRVKEQKIIHKNGKSREDV